MYFKSQSHTHTQKIRHESNILISFYHTSCLNSFSKIGGRYPGYPAVAGSAQGLSPDRAQVSPGRPEEESEESEEDTDDDEEMMLAEFTVTQPDLGQKDYQDI